MKKILGKLMGGVLLLSLSMSLTSCEGALDDILGEWSRPTPGSSTGGAVTSIGLDADEMKLAVGEKGQLTATVAPDNATDKTVTWSSDKEEIATVDANGLVTAVAMGTAIITAKAGDKMATCEVTVLPTLSTPLTVEAITAGTITVTNPKSGMKYSLNGGAKMAVTATPIDVAVGDKVEFYGNGTSITAYYSEDSNDTNDTNISGGLAQVKVYGNIMSLVDETGFAANTTLTATYTFAYLFNGNKKLTDASGLLLPAMTLTVHCYRSMFRDCTSLTTTPKELPATTLADACYASMFYDCASLTTLPEKLLPATEMKQSCYSNMFLGCTSLTTVSEKLLPAEKLAHGCYQEMFERCTSLTTAPALPATNLANFCYIEMFLGCTSLTTAPKLPATTLKNACYSGMFVNCTGLTTAPELPAPTLARNCYYQMFKGCTSLTTAYVKAAYTTSGDACEIMFDGCTAAGTLHTTSANQADWNGVMGSGKTWSTWTTAADWTD